MSKPFDPNDLLKNLSMASLTDTDVESYEMHLIKIMMFDDCTLKEALVIDFDMAMLNKKNIYELVDHLEERLEDLNKVAFYMDIFTDAINDMRLTKTSGKFNDV